MGSNMPLQNIYHTLQGTVFLDNQTPQDYSKHINQTHRHTPESWLLPLVVVVDDSVWNHFEGLHRDGRDVLKLQLLHRVAARA